jgi:hypothetical protein
MRKMTTVIASALVTVLLLTLATTVASAIARLEVDTTAMLITGRLTFDEEPAGELPQIICDVTLHSTLRRLINKVRLESAGAITAVLTANCRNSIGAVARATPLTGMTIHYDSIRGTLPTITGGLVWVQARFLMETTFLGLAIACLYDGLVGSSSAENPVRRLTVLRTSIPLSQELPESALACPENGTLQGPLTVTPEVGITLLER